MANIKYADPTYTLITPTDDDQVMFRTGAGADGRAPLVQPKGYIDGLKLEWVSGSQIRVTPGAAYVPGPKRISELAASVTLTPSLSASTIYHVYLTVSGATVSAEAVTTAPSSPYSGTARTKSGDTSRRYLGSFRTTTGSAITKFRHDGLLMEYMDVIANYGGQVLSAGMSTTPTNVSCSAVVPVTSTMALINFANFAEFIAVIANTDCNYTLSSSNWLFALNPSSRLWGFIPLASNQTFNYMMFAAPASNGLLANLVGYQFER